MFASNKELRIKSFGHWVTIDPLLPLALIGLTLLLSLRYFPMMVSLQIDYWYWILGISSAISLLFSILFHEFGHAFAARILHIPIERVHIYLFGGMVELRHRPLLPNQEFFVSLAGPIASGVLTLIAFIILSLFEPTSQPIFYFSIHFIAYMNLMLVAFNLIPVYPLDGGRVLRALLWKSKKNFYVASKLMHRFSSTLIGLVFIFAVIQFFFNSYYSFWSGVFGLYVAYLLLKAKSELTKMPLFREMVFHIEEDQETEQIIQKVLKVNADALSNAVIPIRKNGVVLGGISGETIISHYSTNKNKEEEIIEFTIGNHINLTKPGTFSNDIHYDFAFVPILNSEELLGLCDAYEMRFWLNETSYLDGRTTKS